MIEFNKIPNNITIGTIYSYTYRDKNTKTRFSNSDRDILPSRLFISQRKLYKRNKEGKYNTPDSLLMISSTSAPQYKPYTKYKGKDSKKQMKIKHTYDIALAIQLDSNDCYSFNSKIIWRVGSQKKWLSHPNQNQIRTIYKETRERWNRKYNKLSTKEKKKAIDKEIAKIKKNEYLDVGDYNSRVLGINGDNYFRCYPLQVKYGCLYGRSYFMEIPDKIKIPFFCKHMLGTLYFLLKKGILKGYN